MADTLTPEQRHRAMSRVRSKNTAPEMLIRQGLHAMGLRFRIHDKKLTGKPDLVFPRYRVAVFVHGCFWHKHGCKKHPDTNNSFWSDKFDKNTARDRKNIESLLSDGWRLLVVWECAVRGRRKMPYCLLLDEICRFILKQNENFKEIPTSSPKLPC